MKDTLTKIDSIEVFSNEPGLLKYYEHRIDTILLTAFKIKNLSDSIFIERYRSEGDIYNEGRWHYT